MSSISSSSRLQRSSISPFRSRKPPSSTSAAPPKPAGRPTTPSSGRKSTPVFARPTTPSNLSKLANSPGESERPESSKGKENVTVTVRFRPLSAREIGKGDEIAWYADGDYAVRYEYNANTVYGFDRVFGPATTTRHVYDVAAQNVISGAMKGMNGTVFAYGVTSSGKTHTMHGEQKSPGIIPLAVKDIFGIIQETPGREFLLRVSYLEIYNEVINDLLDPTGQNLRIREDTQGTYVEGIKEEVVLSPAHALSLIASGEEHRHVGSNNFNLFSSRSHTIFTLTVESSPCRESLGEDDVTLSQLHLIDLAGSESSKTETTGLRRKEGSYINKSLLTLGTVISKLTDGKASHVPYRDSKLTRLLQSSLSGHGHVSLICTVTPASSNSEETHNTLKFAHRSKDVEIKASQNKIIDEKSLIKKYQSEISSLKQELLQLKSGMKENTSASTSNQEDLINLKLQLEAGQMKLQSRLEEEEQAKAALMGRIQRLTKLILVSTKNPIPASGLQKSGQRRRHSFGEDELAYLLERKREYMIDDDDTGSIDSELTADGFRDVTNLDELVNDDKRNRRRGMLGWFKLKRPENIPIGSPSTNIDGSVSGSPSSRSRYLHKKVMPDKVRDGERQSNQRRDSSSVNMSPGQTHAGDLFNTTFVSRHRPPTGTTIVDQIDLFREKIEVLAGEIDFSTSSLKRLSDRAASAAPGDSEVQDQMFKLENEIGKKKLQMHMLERQMLGSVEATPQEANGKEMSQAFGKLATQLNENIFELEVKSADNRILQEQLQMKMTENIEMQETILLLRRQLDSMVEKCSCTHQQICHHNRNVELKTYPEELSRHGEIEKTRSHTYRQYGLDDRTPTSVMSLKGIFSHEDSNRDSQVLVQVAKIEDLNREKVKLAEEKDGLEIQSWKLAEEASYAKDLASAAAVELRNLAEEVTRLSYQNAELTGDLAVAREISCHKCCRRTASYDVRKSNTASEPDAGLVLQYSMRVEELQKELSAKCQREASFETELSERKRAEYELQKRLEEAKKHEEALETELANMWVRIARMRESEDESPSHSYSPQNKVTNGLSSDHNSTMPFKDHRYQTSSITADVHNYKHTDDSEFRSSYLKEKSKCEELVKVIARLKGDDVDGLDMMTLEDLQNFHVEAITKICHAKVYSR